MKINPHDHKMAEKAWRKVLYENQDVPDNYVDKSFLDEMRKNLYIRTYEYWTVVKASGEITQQISSVCLFVTIFIYMNEKTLSPDTLVIMTTAWTIIGYCISLWLDRTYQECGQGHRTDDMKTFLMFIGFSYVLSPVLISLTETISTDTIYAMTTIMLLANLFFHNYGANTALVSEALSLNAGIFASVCLASRLQTSWHSFATVTFSLQVFGLWPLFRKKLKMVVPGVQTILTVTLGLLALLSLLSVSMASACVFVAGHIFITFVCPAWLISLQPYKNNIHGPWDEAIIKAG